jgi:hypothetical protein
MQTMTKLVDDDLSGKDNRILNQERTTPELLKQPLSNLNKLNLKIP